MSKQSTSGYIILGGFAALLLYLLSKGNTLLHETVSSSIVTAAGTITSDPLTGAPQFDASDTRTYDPARYAGAVAPIDTNGRVTQYPSDPVRCTCPQGFEKWKDVVDNSYWCFPT